ncbi:MULTISPECIES: thioredoxin-disulfide reductase [Desulfococcus]|jgi:thioredoxin reductase (NADPH)|uniref:Thioredoxin reductase n=1 Tax=Desulfococcus multivorans DSM 2059 TaxID=1121405 RepID=S7V7I7_DESML|nr:thioredoxin-disulfide reductase [Desulfococcus multivorans]AOY58310.1 TrxB3: thioredoxin reductase [Desulfococcus multivorans]AQV00645.1 thioredoxin-disulfide reductase [Desulfococcus multivorans]EPR42614.1 thioredoxin reductase [Desulfococcus multivorans DSM 2059]MDX9818708.1 thioredoxin-disulfide reductase [Desulfococcus multivorans]SKA17823.1 thioredoxin reductase (NADPH) [Desulfococcus multivorans DSM 2059]
MTDVDADLVIIGGGPAGLTAGLYGARARLRTLLLEGHLPGGQVLITDWVENYPGYPDGITGVDLVRGMTEQAQRFGMAMETLKVDAVVQDGSLKIVSGEGREIRTHAVIIATGASPRKLGVPGEDQFFGKGISSCATCDGPFYKDRVVAAVGGGDTAVQESVFLTRFAGKVYLIHRRDRLRAEKILQERALANEKIEVLWDTVVTGVSGLTHVENIHIRNLKTGEARTLRADAFFVWIGIRPNADFIGDTVRRDDWGFILTDHLMATSVPGIFAAGDVRATPLRQIATAVGDGALAAWAAEHYIEQLVK